MRKLVPIIGASALLALCCLGGLPRATAAPALLPAPRAIWQRVCGLALRPHYARCHAILRLDLLRRTRAAMALGATVTPSGYGPADLQSAYNLVAASASNGVSQTVAIVDAFDDPKAEADLGVYRAQFGLPACTTANGCFRKVDQTGGTSYPASNTGWAEEISLDLDMVSAICPNCHILLVEATNNQNLSLALAVDEAAALGATAISNSYGGAEASSELSLASHYNHPGIAITASSGDSGFGAQQPAAFNTVISVGGTTLRRSTTGSRGWTETTWSCGSRSVCLAAGGTGSGCSAFVSKPAWQAAGSCANRTIADVSAVANPSTGVAVYDSFGQPGWLVFGGTSVASPIIASVYALAGNEASITPGSYLYGHVAGNLNDVTSGRNGRCGTYVCIAGVGYDGPTGNGTPNGLGAF